MDEKEFKQTYSQFNEAPCAFAKAILRRCAACSRAQRVFIAEREAVACLSPGGRDRCLDLLQQMRARALFALRLTHLKGPLPHAKEMKVQCGGLKGLESSLQERGAAESPQDINAMLKNALALYGSPGALPYSEMVQSVVHYEVRSRRGS